MITNSKRVYICFASDNIIPDLIPFYFPEFKPDIVVLFNTAEKSDKGKRFLDIIKKYGVDIREELVSYIGYEETIGKIRQIIKQYKKNEIILNLTGGTKIMSLAAYEGFVSEKSNGCIIYINADSGNVIEIYPLFKEYIFDKNVDVGDFVNSFGYKLKGSSFSDNLKSNRGLVLSIKKTAYLLSEIIGESENIILNGLLTNEDRKQSLLFSYIFTFRNHLFLVKELRKINDRDIYDYGHFIRMLGKDYVTLILNTNKNCHKKDKYFKRGLEYNIIMLNSGNFHKIGEIVKNIKLVYSSYREN